jgi:ABC-2 type transport system ATP-binding protein
LDKIVIISSHIFSTLSDTCDEIHLLRKGQQIETVQKDAFGQLENEMKAQSVGNKIELLQA